MTATRTSRRAAAAGVFAVAALAATGCGSISASVDSVSDSVTTAVESVSDSLGASSDSSSGGGTEAAQGYRRDVQSYAVAWLERPDPRLEEFARGLGRIAEQHGVTDWESAPATREALDEVARSPDVDAARRERLQGELARLGIPPR